MGNKCCQKPDDENPLKTLETNDKDKENKIINKEDKYPHDSDSAFKTVQKNDRTKNINPFSVGNHNNE